MGNLLFTPVVAESGGVITTPAVPAQPIIPKHFTPRSEEQHISFVIEVKEDSSENAINNLKGKINKVLCTTLSGYFPELLYYPKDIFKVQSSWVRTKKVPKELFLKKDEIKTVFNKIKLRKFPDLPIRLERLFPGSERNLKNEALFGLDKFLVLTLPIYERQFQRKIPNVKFQSTLFEVSYILRNIEEIKDVNPTNRYSYRLLSSGSDEVSTLPKNWMLNNMHATNLPDGVSGRGIVIGHPDSGWTPHSELNFTNVNRDPVSPTFDLSKDWNVLNDDSTAQESLDGFAITKFHGTATSSVIISKNSGELTGIAPDATIVSIRTISGFDTGVVLLGDADVARAVWYAIQKNVDVVSLSVGGYPMPALECVIAHAVYNNIIVVAAAGQLWPYLVYPAGYPECIAVGASNSRNRPWSDCVKHSKIAISAPGEEVWCATWKNGREKVHTSNGCSFATAFTAGAAALWLKRYGKQTLINGLNNRATLQELFLSHIQRTATRPNNWNVHKSGAGIINISNLLNRDTLPNLATFSGRDWNNWVRRNALELFYSMFENTDPVIVRERLEAFFNSLNILEFLEEFGNEAIDTFLKVENAVEIFARSMESNAEEVLEEVVDKIKDVVSDSISTIAGWFS